ncbi:MAG: DUF1957 domain-containing protein [Bradymonadaceae bacterium]|nr:DUF1957 domain-containing protein [Lujinxingiaceae bacterium]
MAQAHLSIVLHAHLPYVRHPEHVYHLEENWFYEAMHETYLPLLQMLRRLDAQSVPGRLTLSVSAPLFSMMNDAMLTERFNVHLDRLIVLAKSEIVRTQGDDVYLPLAHFYLERFETMKRFYVDELGCDVISELRRQHAAGRIELITCVGTHPILPFLATSGGRRAQVKAACDLFEQTFGFRSKGIWLAECAFSPGMDRFLAEEGISFTFVEENAIENADSKPVYGNFAPLISEHDVAFFGRDQIASAQVWSASEGYPGDFDYREFYRDIGFDLELDYILPFIHPDGIRHNTGLKYHRITGEVALGDKQPYNSELAYQRAWDHAAHFIDARAAQAGELANYMEERPVHMTCPYDSELFGHWWFEGPIFLEGLFHRAAENAAVVMSTPVDYLEQVTVHQKTTPATSTWGEASYFNVWLDESNAWIYRHMRNAETLMTELADEFKDAEGLEERALRQTGRELLLAQSSDWPFIIKTGTTVAYAVQRIEEHIENIKTLAGQIRGHAIDEAFIAKLEAKNNIFPQLDWQSWADNS